MSKRMSLRAFQEHVTARLQNLAAREGDAPRLGLSVGAHRFVVELSDIAEAVPVPPMTRVPLAKPWFCGMANIRGNLYAVSDLAAFFGDGPTPPGTDRRVLIVHPKYQVNAALMVGGVLGLKSVAPAAADDSRPEAPPWAGPEYRDGEGGTWRGLALAALLGDPRFLGVGR
ncbi:MAG: chemotaxis protein CheW [Betaproteobacteria bacterium]|nr:chemotaxis protein CheW [Betaproteobacteria bacterium]